MYFLLKEVTEKKGKIDLLAIGLFPEWLQQPILGHAEARSQEFHSESPIWVQAPRDRDHLNCFSRSFRRELGHK